MKKIIFCCPLCKSHLSKRENTYTCTSNECKHSSLEDAFLENENIPVFISPYQDSVCDPKKITPYVSRGKSFFQPLQLLKTEKLQDLFYGNGKVTRENCKRFIKEIKQISKKPRVLVIASGAKGNGTSKLWSDEDIEVHGLDIYKSPSVDFICDAHYLALEKDQYDGVWAQAVLEHVVSPETVVKELSRVLKHNGIVYAETPFMQQIHEGAYDFNRYGVLGHRYLFKDFDQIKIGGIGGPEVVLSWSIRYFIWSITRSRLIGKFFGLLFAILLRPFSSIISKESLFDAASGSYFLGRKTENLPISHKELIKLYKGNIKRS